MTSTPPVLRFDGVARSFGAVHALREVSFSADAGTVHALLGENGAGKSTLVKILAGLVTPSSGTIELAGRDHHPATVADAQNSGIGVAFQESSLVPDLSVAENLVLGAVAREPRFRRRRNLEAAARSMMEAAQAPTIDVSLPVADLTLAQRQIVEVVKATDRAKRILVLDEANSALSGERNTWFLANARSAAARGVLVLFVSHRLAEVRAIADSATVLRGGLSVLSGTPATTTDDEMVEAMVGRRVALGEPREPSTVTREPLLTVSDLLPRGANGDGVSFALGRGEIVGLAGLDGNGQLEVISAIAGAMPSRGQMNLEGAPYSPSHPADGMAAGVALVPADRQREGLLPSWSIERNITLSSLAEFGTSAWMDRAAEHQAAVSLAQRMSLPAERVTAAASTLSGGNQQRVVLARVLMTQPKLLLLFDGTRGVDVATRASILLLLQEVADAGTTVLFYSSDLSEYAHVADRVLVMSRGALVGELTGSISEEDILRAVVSGGYRPTGVPGDTTPTGTVAPSAPGELA